MAKGSKAGVVANVRCRVGAILLGALAFGIAGGPASAQPVLRACIVDAEPWGYRAHPQRGVYADVFREIGRLSGVVIDYTLAPFARVFEDVRTGACLFTITSWQDTRSTTVTPGEVLATLDYGILPRQGVLLTDYADLKHRTIAVMRGLLIGDPFDSDPEIKKVGVYGYDQAARMVEVGHADGLVGSIVTLRRVATLHHAAEKYGAPLVLSRVPLVLQMNPQFATSPVAAKINAAVATLRENGFATGIIIRYFSTNEPD